MHQRNMVITANHIPQRRQPLFYPLDLDAVRERVAQMLQFLVGCCRWYEEAVFVSILPSERGVDQYILL
jgi:hypothetical protein